MPTIRWMWPLFAAVVWLWAATLPGAALLAATDTVPARAAAAIVYVAGSALCHQRPERSMHLAGTPLPVCARCAGIYWGAAVVALGLALARPGHHRPAPPGARALRATVIAALAVNGGTLAYEWSGGGVPGNGGRALAGALLGAVAAWIVWHATRPDWQSG